LHLEKRKIYADYCKFGCDDGATKDFAQRTVGTGRDNTGESVDFENGKSQSHTVQYAGSPVAGIGLSTVGYT